MSDKRRVMLLGGTGTIGRATAQALLDQGHEVICYLRHDAKDPRRGLPAAAILRFGDVTNAAALQKDGFAGQKFDVLVSCLASRTGRPADAWAIDHQAHVAALTLAQAAGITQMVLLSAICVQKPLLAFQHAKLAFEKVLVESGMDHTIIRPTAFFKSLSGQVERVRQGQPFLIFGDGTLTACKPISDNDLARFIVDSIDNPAKRNKILPIGGPGPAITPLQQGEHLFHLLNRTARYRQVPVKMMDAIIGGVGLLGRFSPSLRDKAELAKIGRYYATQSMLVLNPATGLYDAEATPETGTDTLFEFYESLLNRQTTVDLGAHAMFKRNVA